MCTKLLTLESASLLLPICSANTSHPFFYVISIALRRNAHTTPILKGAAVAFHSAASWISHLANNNKRRKMYAHCWQRRRWWQKAIFPNTRTIYVRRYNNARSPHHPTQTQHTKRVQCVRWRRQKGITPRVLLLMRRREMLSEFQIRIANAHAAIILSRAGIKGGQKIICSRTRKAKNIPSSLHISHPWNPHPKWPLGINEFCINSILDSQNHAFALYSIHGHFDTAPSISMGF